MAQKHKTAKHVGRPALSKRDGRERDATKAADGDRLNAALQLLNLSQAEAGRITGIGQNHINEIVNGTRALYREDLRALSKAGISPEFVLGLTHVHIAPGMTRTARTLADDLAGHVFAAILAEMPGLSALFDTMRQDLLGNVMLRHCVKNGLSEWRDNLEVAKRRTEAHNQRLLLEQLVRNASGVQNAQGVTVERVLEGSIKILQEIADEEYPDGPFWGQPEEYFRLGLPSKRSPTKQKPSRKKP